MADIDIGTPAIDRPNNLHRLLMAKDNPANLSGILTEVEVFLAQVTSYIRIGTCFNVGGNNFTSRDWVEIPQEDLVRGYNKFTGLSISVEAGDYIAEGNTNQVDRDMTIGGGMWYHSTMNFPFTDLTFSFIAPHTISLCGKGAEIEAKGMPGLSVGAMAELIVR